MKEALKTAIECLKIFKDNSNGDPMYTHAIKVLEALAQPAQAPTGMLHIDRLEKWLDASLKDIKEKNNGLL